MGEASEGRFVCWLEGEGATESEGWVYKEGFGTSDAEDAAIDHANAMAESGDYPDHVGEKLCIRVRDRSDGSLTDVWIAWDWDPCPYVSKAYPIDAEATTEAVHG